MNTAAAGALNADDGSCSDAPTVALTQPSSSPLQLQPPSQGSLSAWVKWDAGSSSSSSSYLPVITLRSRQLAVANISGAAVPLHAHISLFLGCPRPLPAGSSAQLCIEVLLVKAGSPAPGQSTVAQSLWVSSGWPWRWRDGSWHHLALLQVGGRGTSPGRQVGPLQQRQVVPTH